jgi:hypothetical protein
MFKRSFYYKKIKASPNKEALRYGCKIPKDIDIALHDDKFLWYGTKLSTKFLVIDVDKSTDKGAYGSLESYYTTVQYKLQGITPSWITKTSRGSYHIGFILEEPVFYDDLEKNAKLAKTRDRLIELFKGDVCANRGKGFFRNPITNNSIINPEAFNINELYKLTAQIDINALNLFDINNVHIHNMPTTPKMDNKVDWNIVEHAGFKKGNRNNYLFKYLINGVINSHFYIGDMDKIAVNINNSSKSPLKEKEVASIINSVKRYSPKAKSKKNCKTNKRPRKRGDYSEVLFENNIHTYRKKGEIVNERQRVGQAISSAIKKSKTVESLYESYLEVIRTGKKLTTKNLTKHTNRTSRTVRYYKNNLKIFKYMAFSYLASFCSINTGSLKTRYIEDMFRANFRIDKNLLQKIKNVVIKSVKYINSKDKKQYGFVFDDDVGKKLSIVRYK